MKSVVFSRGTTFQLPNTQKMLYPPHNTAQGFRVYVVNLLVLTIMVFFKEWPCASWLISSEDTPPPFLPPILVLFCSSSSCYLWVHFIICSLSKMMNPASSYTSPLTLYTIRAAHPGLLKCSVGRACYMEIRGPGSLDEWLSSSLMLVQPC